VGPDTMARRSAQLHRLGAAKLQAHSEKFLGRTLDVLFESCEEGYWTGYTGNYLRVAVRSKEDLTNLIRAVRLDHAAGELIFGTLL
jgi:threonylcarbamoyladenosine tRNA methylthiotransferase MtaB